MLLLTTGVASGIECGDVITADAVLTADVGPCPGDSDPVLTLVGPATLNLNGYTVRGLPGAQTAVGILIQGERARLRNGFVESCESAAVVVAGAGGHRIENVIARNNTNDGFQVQSSRNHLVRNVTMNSHDDGFAVSGSGNLLLGNAAFDDALGFSLTGERNALIRNAATRCQEVGIGASGSRHRIVDNRVVGSGLDGIAVSGSAHFVSANQSIANDQAGIDVRATATRVFGNVALGNDGPDLTDANPSCGDDLWRGNVFSTSDPACIR